MDKMMKCAGKEDTLTMRAEDDGDTVAFLFEAGSELSFGVGEGAWGGGGGGRAGGRNMLLSAYPACCCCVAPVPKTSQPSVHASLLKLAGIAADPMPWHVAPLAAPLSLLPQTSR